MNSEIWVRRQTWGHLWPLWEDIEPNKERKRHAIFAKKQLRRVGNGLAAEGRQMRTKPTSCWVGDKTTGQRHLSWWLTQLTSLFSLPYHPLQNSLPVRNSPHKSMCNLIVKWVIMQNKCVWNIIQICCKRNKWEEQKRGRLTFQANAAKRSRAPKINISSGWIKDKNIKKK